MIEVENSEFVKHQPLQDPTAGFVFMARKKSRYNRIHSFWRPEYFFVNLAARATERAEEPLTKDDMLRSDRQISPQ